MNKSCCSSFSSLLEENESRGFSIIKEKTGDAFIYKFAFRCVQENEEKELLDILKAGESTVLRNISLYGEIGLSYCPWCGKKLN